MEMEIEKLYGKVKAFLNIPMVREEFFKRSTNLEGFKVFLNTLFGRDLSDSEIQGILNRLVKDGTVIVYTKENEILIAFVYGTVEKEHELVYETKETEELEEEPEESIEIEVEEESEKPEV